MSIHYLPILKAKNAEFKAIEHLLPSVRGCIAPLFDLNSPSDLEAKWFKNAAAPWQTHVDRVATRIVASAQGELVFLDASCLAPNHRTESEEPLIARLASSVVAQHGRASVVIGMDRWDDDIYQQALRITHIHDREVRCLRIANDALRDYPAEPQFFREVLGEIAGELMLVPQNTLVLVDLHDLTGSSLDESIDHASRVLGLMMPLGFRLFAVAGCSMPATVNDAVPDYDSEGFVIRQELLVLRALSVAYPAATLIASDYGVRSPRAQDAPSGNNTNAKLRYTVPGYHFVVRGRLKREEKGQMEKLAARLMQSPHYKGLGYSWGDRRIAERARDPFEGSTEWLAVDLNHHIHQVVMEALERVSANPVTA